MKEHEKSCRLFAVLQLQQPAKGSKKLVIAATSRNRKNKTMNESATIRNSRQQLGSPLLTGGL
jgi:hypothetical protein